MKQFFAHFRDNWKAGLTVSLVSIPLSISLAVAGGASPVAGIVTAIWAGLVAALIGGSLYNVVGPTGALSGILASYALTAGAGALPMLALVSGLFILAAWALRLERYLIFIPANTIQGFTLGVSLIIALNQLNAALGLSGLPSHERFLDGVYESFRHLGSAAPEAMVTFGIFLVGIFLFDEVRRRVSWMPLPGTVLLAPAGILLGYASMTGGIPFHLETLGERFADIAPTLALSWQPALARTMLLPALTVALVAILETMLSARIADVLTKTKHDKRREMLGLGLANVASGLVGGIPATAALARTTLNIKSGANDRMAGIVNAISVAVVSLFFLAYFRYIPMAVIAAILVVVAIRMIEGEHFKRMYRIDRTSFYIALVVAFVTVYEDPMTGILVGTTISLFFFLEKLSHGQFELAINDSRRRMVGVVSGEEIEDLPTDTHTLVYSIKGPLTYIDGQAHLARFERNLTAYEHVILRLRELSFVDLDGIDAFEEIVEAIEARGKRVLVTGASAPVVRMLRESPRFRRLRRKGCVFSHTAEALNHLGFEV